MKPKKLALPQTRKCLALDKQTVKHLKVKSGVRAGSFTGWTH